MLPFVPGKENPQLYQVCRPVLQKNAGRAQWGTSAPEGAHSYAFRSGGSQLLILREVKA